jgi:hypothetical protein
MKLENIEDFLSKATTCPSKWELDTIIWADRTTNLKILVKFLERIRFLNSKSEKTSKEVQELTYLLELLDDMEESDCTDLLNLSDDEIKDSYIENLARTSAIEVLTNGKISFESMNIACKLSPNDFILCAKRTQDLMNAISGLVVKGETLSKDVAGA